MKRKWMLVAATVLAIVMAVSLGLVGCKTTTTTAAAAETTTAAETTAAAETTTAAETTAAGGQFITIHWAQWAPADYLQKLSEGFTKETGIKVIVEQTPWETFVQKYNTEMIAKSDAWDIIVGDSQDVGTMALGGHYVDLTSWIKEKGVDKSMTPASMTAYAEYPKGSGTFWSVPVEGDALGWAYRKDLFEDAKNKEAFKAKYGYDLGVPTDYAQLLDIAKFFHNPDKDFYGIAIYGDNGYDSMVMFLEQSMWTYGGDIGDQKTMQVEGILNSPASIEGTESYRELFKYTPPAFGDAFFIKTNDAFTGGKVPITSNYFAFLPALANEATSPYAKDTGYFPNPPHKASDGKTYQASAIGGQGASVVTYSKKQDLAFKWLEWFIRPDVQAEWAKLGGYSCNSEVLKSKEFLDAAPYNPAFATTLNIMRDFWAVPEYSELLKTMSTAFGKYITEGKGTAKEAADKAAADWTQIFKDAGYLK
ncbi:MAG: ABC transporter substrate-binding protein [Candidatus Humimicrobiaceae bacterium]